ncbi:MAG: hypothetical protein R3183_10065 [Oleiphilaceae bacterium]|nr:hypothetical protein [Oleiphilaceae bacterium]
MSDKQANDDVLNALYAKTKHELPPAEIDQHILAEARQHCPNPRKAQLATWQRILSVAAAMLFTVYIFFDVRQLDHPDALTEHFDDASPSSLSAPAEMRAEKALPELEMKEQMFEADEAQEGFAPYADQSGTALSREPRQAIEAPAATPQVATPSAKLKKNEQAEAFTDESAPSPESMVMRVRELIRAGELEQARVLLDSLKTIYPDYAIPADLARLSDNSAPLP